MISFAKVTKSTYDALTPVQDRLYYIEDTGEQFLNGKPYNGDDGTRDWLCFTAAQANSTIRLDKVGFPWNISLETSTDGINWTAYTWDDTTGATITLANMGDKVFWRGDNNTFSQAGSNRYQYVMTGYIKASGNIMSLLRKDCSLMEFAENDQRFQYLFADCASLLTAPKLPATKLGYHTYNHCFCNCTGLTEVPELPATSFLDSCYANIFDGCTGLTTVPPLPYTGTIPCCWGMYANCTGITSVEVPEFMYMGANHLKSAFYGCTNLRYVKVSFHSFDSATTDWLDGVSTTGTFICPSDLVISSRSTSTVPAGWTITRADAVQSDWNTSDSTAPAFIKNKPVIKDKNNYLCLEVMSILDENNDGIGVFTNGTVSATLEYSYDRETWTSLTLDSYIPQTTTLGAKVYIRGDNSTFSVDSSNYIQFNFDNVEVAVSGNIMSLLSKDLSKTEVPSYAFYKLFYGCGLLMTAPELPAKKVNAYSYGSMFYECTSLTKAPELPAIVLGSNCYEAMFRGCTMLMDVPAKLPAMNLADACYKQLFKGCTALTEAPVLPATTMAQQCYVDMLAGCSSLQTAPDLPATTLATECYGGMFGDCVSLTSLPANYLPATTLARGCYQWMFYGCTGLKNGCNLPAGVLAQACYSWMYGACTALLDSGNISASILANAGMEHLFDGCTSLCRVKIPSMTAWNTSCTSEWLKGLNWLQRAFVCHASLDTTSRGISTIPQGWIACRSAYGADGLVPMWTLNNTNFTFAPCTTEQDKINITANGLTLNAISVPSGYVGSAYLYIYWYSFVDATITAGTGIDFVDTPRKGYLSYCIVTWDGIYNAKLRVMWETAL